MEKEAVGQDGKERREAFDGVDERHRYLLGGCGGKYVAANLEKGERHGGSNDIPAGISNSVLQSWYSSLQARE